MMLFHHVDQVFEVAGVAYGSVKVERDQPVGAAMCEVVQDCAESGPYGAQLDTAIRQADLAPLERTRRACLAVAGAQIVLDHDARDAPAEIGGALADAPLLADESHPVAVLVEVVFAQVGQSGVADRAGR